MILAVVFLLTSALASNRELRCGRFYELMGAPQIERPTLFQIRRKGTYTHPFRDSSLRIRVYAFHDNVLVGVMCVCVCVRVCACICNFYANIFI